MADWGGFERRLASALRAVTDRVFLIISAADNPLQYVQFAATGQQLDAEASGPGVTPGVDSSVLEGAGWRAPGAGQPNWTCTLPGPALGPEYEQLAARCVVALRDAQAVPSPEVLVYQAWREPGGTDAGENPLHIPELGLAPPG